MKKTLTLACLAAMLAIGLSPAPAFASRVDGGQPGDSCTRFYEICFWI